MKTNLTNWLCGLCAVLLIAVLIFQFKQQGRLDALQRQQESLSSAVSQHQQQQRDLAASLANQVTNLSVNLESRLAHGEQQAKSLSSAVSQQQQQQRGLAAELSNQVTNLSVSLEARLAQGEQQAKEKAAEIANAVQQQTAVMHRALGKVIPVELPESLTNTLGALEMRIADEKSWPKNTTEADAMLAELRDLVRQIPPWAEEDMLPRLNALRWNAQSLQVLQTNANANGEGLEIAAEAFANQLSTQPEAGSTNIATKLASRQAGATQRFAAYRREAAIKAGKEQLGLPVTTDALAVWQRLSEWTNHPTDGQQVLVLRQRLRSRLLEDEVTKFADATKANLQKFNAVTNVALRHAGYFRTMESVTVQRLTLLAEPDAPASAVSVVADLSASVEALIKKETEKQKNDDAERVLGYQRWTLKNLKAFNFALEKQRDERRPYTQVKDAMIKYLIPISPAHLDSAVAKIYSQAFEAGWKKLDVPDAKHLQTEVANEDAKTAKKTPQNYQE